MLFDFRDADCSDPGLFAQFGILGEDNTPKPALDRYRRLVASSVSQPSDSGRSTIS